MSKAQCSVLADGFAARRPTLRLAARSTIGVMRTAVPAPCLSIEPAVSPDAPTNPVLYWMGHVDDSQMPRFELGALRCIALRCIALRCAALRCAALLPESGPSAAAQHACLSRADAIPCVVLRGSQGALLPAVIAQPFCIGIFTFV